MSKRPIRGNKKQSIIAMIPARMGSTRLPAKNLALLNGRPLIYYAIKAAKDAKVFDRIVVNSEDEVFSKVAERYKVEFYKRPTKWATSNAKSDSVVYDFVEHNPCDIVVWVNPTSPLQEGEEISEAMDRFKRKKLDSLITVKNEQVHCIYNNKPINFKKDNMFAKTQDLTPTQPFVYSIMMWRTSVFKKTFEKKGHALFCGKTGYYPVSRLSTVIIKKKEDLMMAEYLLKTMKKRDTFKLRYDRLAKSVRS